MFLNVPGPISLTAQSLWGIAPWTDQQISWIYNQFLIFRRWYYSTLALFLSGFVCWGWKKCEKALNNNNFKKKSVQAFTLCLVAHIHTCTVSLWDWRHFCWWFLESRPDRCHELLQWEFSGGQSGWMGAWRGEQVAVKITSICNSEKYAGKKGGLSKNLKSLPTTQKFKHKNTQRPQVCTHVVAFARDDFRCHVAQRTTKRPRFLTHLNLL